MQISITAILVVSSWLAIGEVEKASEQNKLSAVASLVGSWEGRAQMPTGQTFVVPDLTYQWALDNRVITFHSTTNLANGETLQKRTGMIFWDPSDKKVKMWVVDSAGGNIQATLTEVSDSELAWDADAVLPDGKRTTFQFSIVIEGTAKHIVQRGDVTFEMQRKEKP